MEEDPDLFVKIHCGPLPDVRASKQSFRGISYPEWRPDRRHKEGVTKSTASRHPRPTTHDYFAPMVYLPVHMFCIIDRPQSHLTPVAMLRMLDRYLYFSGPIRSLVYSPQHQQVGSIGQTGRIHGEVSAATLTVLCGGAEHHAWVRCPYEYSLIFDTSLRVL